MVVGYSAHADRGLCTSQNYNQTLAGFLCANRGSFCMLDSRKFDRQLELWSTLFPLYKAYFKPNGLEFKHFISPLHCRGIGFDCVNRRELHHAAKCLDEEQSPAFLYSNPYKFRKDISEALRNESTTFVVDSVDDLLKIKRQLVDLGQTQSPPVILRLFDEAEASSSPFNSGCLPGDIETLVGQAKSLNFHILGISLSLTEVSRQEIGARFDCALQVLRRLGEAFSLERAVLHVDMDSPSLSADVLIHSVAPAVQQCSESLASACDFQVHFSASVHDFFVRSALVVATQVGGVDMSFERCSIKLSTEHRSLSESEMLQLDRRTLTQMYFCSRFGLWANLTEDGEEAVQLEFEGFPGGPLQRARLSANLPVTPNLRRGDWLFWSLDSNSVDLQWRASLPMLVHGHAPSSESVVIEVAS